MKMKEVRLGGVARVGLIIFLLIQLVCSTAIAQGVDGNSARKVVRKNGWKVPSITSGLFSVRSLIEYEANGNIFAYEVSMIPTDANRNGTRTTLGVAYGSFYVDEDGDGNFESRYDNGRLPSLPRWVKTGNPRSSRSGSR